MSSWRNRRVPSLADNTADASHAPPSPESVDYSWGNLVFCTLFYWGCASWRTVWLSNSLNVTNYIQKYVDRKLLLGIWPIIFVSCSFDKGEIFVVHNDMGDGWLWVTSQATMLSGIVNQELVQELVSLFFPHYSNGLVCIITAMYQGGLEKRSW